MPLALRSKTRRESLTLPMPEPSSSSGTSASMSGSHTGMPIDLRGGLRGAEHLAAWPSGAGRAHPAERQGAAMMRAHPQAFL